MWIKVTKIADDNSPDRKIQFLTSKPFVDLCRYSWCKIQELYSRQPIVTSNHMFCTTILQVKDIRMKNLSRLFVILFIAALCIGIPDLSQWVSD